MPIKLFCRDCGPLPKSHFQKYIESLAEYLFPRLDHHFPFIDRFLQKLALHLGLVEREENFSYEHNSLRTTIFVDEGKKRGWRFWSWKGPRGYINHYEMELNGKIFSFEGLPRAEFLHSARAHKIDDKAFIKKILMENNVPVAVGQHFWFYQKLTAQQYGLKLGFPLMIKPRSGSMSQHITINIQNAEELRQGIERAVAYDPCFIVERYLTGVKVFRATVIDGQFVATVERVPANVVGDGERTIKELVELKNSDPRRGQPRAKDMTCYKLVLDDTSARLLVSRGFTLSSVPALNERVDLQEKVILDLGADLLEVTPQTHPDNIKLFELVADLFKIKLVGIDFLAADISRSYKEQNSAIMELNSLPYIDMHHFPTSGEPVNVAGKICDLVEKYYI